MNFTRRGDVKSPAVRPPRRTHYPNLSPTRAPSVDADARLWPAWTRVPLERLGFVFPIVQAPAGGGN